MGVGGLNGGASGDGYSRIFDVDGCPVFAFGLYMCPTPYAVAQSHTPEYSTNTKYININIKMVSGHVTGRVHNI